jgi:AcrR family transcriptional regulator
VREREGYDEKLSRILRIAAETFAERGYHQASIRDIAAATDISLSGLYYYFRSKEELLFLIQDHVFGEILDRASRALSEVESPEDQLRTFVHIHLSFFVDNMAEMRVLSHEARALSGDFRERVGNKKREYTALVQDILARLRPDRPEGDLRLATFSLFGMLNWIYTWYRPGRDPSAEALAREMSGLFLRGFLSAGLGDEEPAPPVADASGSFWPRS